VLEWARGADVAVPPSAPLDHRALREAAYERLADVLVDSIDPRLLRDLGAA